MKRKTKKESTSKRSFHDGYIFLVTVLVVGAIATAATISLMILGLAAEQNGFTIMQSTQAIEHAHGCIERGLLSLRGDLAYAGSQTTSFPHGSCHLLSVGGSGNEDRTLCAEGVSGDTVRRLEVTVDQVYPVTRIDSWKEVASITRCP